VTVNSATQIQAVTPAKAAGLVDVTVQNSNGQSGIMTGAFTYTAPPPVGPPTITSISPNSGASGTQVTINGANFSSGAAVAFGGTNATSTVFVSSTQLTAFVPTLVTGTYDVNVIEASGSATLTSGFAVTAAQSLLSGVHPPDDNCTGFSIPSGWTCVLTQTFESGALGANQYVLDSRERIASNTPTGSKAMAQLVNIDGSNTGVGIQGSAINSREVYASWYEYVDAQALLNLQILYSRRVAFDSGGNTLTDLLVDIEAGAGGCIENCTKGLSSIYAEGRGAFPNFSNYGGPTNFIAGTLTQIEVHIKANDPGQSNGLIEWFQNGKLIQRAANQNFNASLDMATADLEIGGYYGALVYFNDAAMTQCTAAQTFGAFAKSNTSWGACQCSAQCPPNGHIPAFNRYIDDIIVIRK
jgi:hypothetical protein